MIQRSGNEHETGWSYIDAPERGAADNPSEAADIPMIFARCFLTTHGALVLQYLRSVTVDRIIGPSAPDSLLRHAEGQRHLVKTIETLVARGRGSRDGVASDFS